MTAVTAMTGRPATLGAAHTEFDLGDHLQLERHVHLTEQGAQDTLTGRALTVNATAHTVLALLADGGRYGELADRYAEAFVLDASTARSEVRAVATALDAAALLVVTPSRLGRLHPSTLLPAAQRVATLEWFQPPARRYPATLRGLLTGTARSARVTLWGSSIAGLLLLCMLIAVSRSAVSLEGAVLTTEELERAFSFAASPVLLAAVLLAQLAAHEGGHLLTARRSGANAFLVTRGMRIYVAHDAHEPRLVRRIAVVGPLGGVLAALLTAAVLPLSPLPPMVVLAVAAMALPHLWSLLPWSSDGRAIWARPTAGPSAGPPGRGSHVAPAAVR